MAEAFYQHIVYNVYDANRRLVGVTSSDPSCASDFVNDVFGRMTGASNAVATYGYSLSSDGYRDAEGNTVAEYVYDAFGRTVAQNGTMADMFAIRYSTKYYDKESN